MIVSMKKKLVLALSTSVLALSLVIAPISAFASTPNPVNQLSLETQAIAPNQVDDGTVTTMGVKKSVFVFALKHGGELLEDLLTYLGKKEYADYVKDNRLLIADFLESTELVVEKSLVNFLIFECGIPQGAARVIASAIMFIAF
ncbi:hypothetical protein [Paenibacillus sp. QZ-Y1]|uniref:hypothetical protein n=1 Tax=Paenibacillus sp. QZ-Y1 TaxID=3414511 RepID=UPI003F7A052F